MTDPPHAASHPSLAGINDGSTQSRKTGNMSGVLSPTRASALLLVLDFMRGALPSRRSPAGPSRARSQQRAPDLPTSGNGPELRAHGEIADGRGGLTILVG